MFLVATIIFLGVVVAVISFGAAAYAPSSALGARLESLGFDRPPAPRRASIRERLDKILEPVSRALPLSQGDRSRAWLVQAGYRERRHLVFYAASKGFGPVPLFGIAVRLAGFRPPALIVGESPVG